MLRILYQVLGVIFPVAPAVGSLATETPTSFRRYFEPSLHQNCVVLSRYTHPKVKAAVTANKFHHDPHATKLLAYLLEAWLTTLPKPQPYVIVPIPLSGARLRERGHNQVTSVAALVSQSVAIPIDDKLLYRTRNTAPQSHLDKDDRNKNIAGAFRCRDHNNHQITPQTHIIILDDVLTTGATMAAAKAALTEHFPHHRIICLALAH